MDTFCSCACSNWLESSNRLQWRNKIARTWGESKTCANCVRFSITGIVLQLSNRLRRDSLDCLSMLYLNVPVKNNKALSPTKRLAQDFSSHCPRAHIQLSKRSTLTDHIFV